MLDEKFDITEKEKLCWLLENLAIEKLSNEIV